MDGIKRAKEIWNESISLESDRAYVANLYLKNRGIDFRKFRNFRMPPGIRFHESLYFKGGEDDQPMELPALICELVDSKGRFQGIQRVYLSKEGKKADVPSPKKVLGTLKESAVILGNPEMKVCLAEGVETGLAIHGSVQTPVIACLTEGNLRQIVLPANVTEVEIWYDNDRSKVGQSAAEACADRLTREGRTVFLVGPEEFCGGEKNDWLDVLNEFGPDALISSAMKRRLFRVKGPTLPQPLFRALPPAPNFPMDCLGEILGEAAKRLQESIQAPDGICGQSILAGAALAVQGLANVEIDGRSHPISEFFLTIGESGERKTAVDYEVLKPHREFEKRLIKENRRERDDHAVALRAHEIAIAEVKRGKQKSPQEIKARLEEIGNPPPSPLEPIVINSEPTFEGLIRLLTNGFPSQGVFSDEAGRMIGGHSLKEDQKLSTIAGFSKLWDGSAIDRVRAGDGASKVFGKRVSMHLMAQKRVADQMLSDELMGAQGFLARFLVCFPNSTVGSRLYREDDLTNDQYLERYRKRVELIYALPLNLEVGTRNDIAPKRLRLSTEAKNLYKDFHDRIEGELRDGGKYDAIKAFAIKGAEHACRIAGILTLFENCSSDMISEQSMMNAIFLIEDFYLPEALRIFGSIGVDMDLWTAQKVIDWVNKKEMLVLDVNILTKNGPKEVRDIKQARKVIQTLISTGYLIKLKTKRKFAVYEQSHVPTHADYADYAKIEVASEL